MKKTFLPPATIGILGSGQLGRMLALAARQMGYRVHVFSPERHSPTGQIADQEFTAAYDDLDAVRQFAQSVDVVTYEFENVPAETAVTCQEFAPLHPGPRALHVAQNRLREKEFMVKHGLPVAPFVAVSSLASLLVGLEEIGVPTILKTATSGYDGKGQQRLERLEDAAEAWQAVGERPSILEGFIDFEREVSVVAAHGTDGSFAHFGVIANDHANHILDVSTAPADVPPEVAQEAVAMARTVLEALDVVGVLCVEFFLTGDGRLLINEIAPRPHNSGHLTIEACATSQFEQQLRAICGLPLGDTRYLSPAAMANLLGDLWFPHHTPHSALRTPHSPHWTAVLAHHPALKLHLYGKQTARPGRKMGHITALAATGEEAANIVREARRRLETGD